jgi:hypothetical protein
MATRRRYKSSPRGYREGGAVPPEPEARADATPPSRPELPPSPPEDQDAVRRVADATRRAEEYQRQAAQQPLTIEQKIDRMTDLSDYKRTVLKRNPMLMNDQIMPLAARAYEAALAEGIPDDTDEMTSRILAGVRQGIEAHRQRQIEAADAALAAMQAPPTPEPSVERAAKQLANEAETHRMAMNAEDATPQWLSATLPVAPPTPRARSLPVSAPVSRDVPTASGGRALDARSIVLSPAEREIARNSFGPIKDASGNWVDLSNAEKEFRYAQGKARLAALRASGEYPERERN